MVDTQREWQLEAGKLAAQNVLDTIDVLKNALSEGNLSADTLSSLITESPVFAGALQHTTTGQYVDTAKMQEIIQQQGDYAMQLAETQQAAAALDFSKNEAELDRLSNRTQIAKGDINALNKAIEENPDNPDYQRMFDLTQANNNIRETILNLQALQEELKYQQSALGKYQLAQSTANASDNMQTIRGGLEGAKQLYDQGWIGKDDFTTFADLIATDAEIAAGTAVENFEKNYERVQRYLTENSDGVENWIDDMIAKSKEYGTTWATQVGNELKVDVDNMEEFAKAMGTSKEFAEDMLMAMNDAGYTIDLSIIGDQYANDFQSIDYMAANAGQQVKNLITEMSNLAMQGIDVSGGAEAAAEAIQKLADTGVDVSDLVDQFNELGKLNGWKLELGENGELTFSSEFMSAAEKQAAREASEKEIPLYTKFNIEEAEVTNANNALQRAFQGNKADMQQAIKDSGILDYDFSELMNIDHADGQLSAGEQELEAFAHSLGLADEQCSALLVAMAQLGLIDVEPEVDTSQIEDANTEVDELTEAADKEVDIKIGVKNNVEDITAVEDWVKQHNFDNATIMIQTEIAKGSITPQEILSMSDEQIALHFNVDGEDKIQAIKDAAEAINAQDGADFTIKINEEQLNSLIDAVNGQQETPVEVEMETTAWDEFKEEIEEGLEVNVKPKPPTNGEYTEGKEGNIVNPVSPTQNRSGSSSGNTKSDGASPLPAIPSAVDGGLVVPVVYDPDTKLLDKAEPEVTEEVKKDVVLEYKTKGQKPKETTTTSKIKTEADSSSLDSTVSRLQAAASGDYTAQLNVDNSQANAAVDESQDKIDSLTGKTVPLKAQNFVGGVVSNIQSAINSLTGKTVTIETKTKGQELIDKMKQTIDNIKSKTVSIVSNITQKIFGGSTGGATGTAHVQAIGTAHSSGTAYRMWTDYRHSKGAYADGSTQDWRLSQDEDALVNEVGTESIVRDGRWFEIPGNAHIESLKRGDIIFSAKQTEELKKYGKVYSGGGHGRVAYSNGTAYNMINAYADRNTSASGGGTRKKKTTTTSSNTGSGNGNGTNTGSNNSKSNPWDDFTKWLDRLFDWIEVRIERVQGRIDNLSQKSENAVGYLAKNNPINEAMDVISRQKGDYTLRGGTYDGAQRVTGIDIKGTYAKGTQMYNNLYGAQRYFKQAEDVAKKAAKTGKTGLSEKNINDIIPKIQAGTIDIREYNEEQRKFIESYKEW